MWYDNFKTCLNNNNNKNLKTTILRKEHVKEEKIFQKDFDKHDYSHVCCNYGNGLFVYNKNGECRVHRLYQKDEFHRVCNSHL